MATRTWIVLTETQKNDIDLIEKFTKENPHFIGVKTREEIIQEGIHASIATVKEKLGHEFYKYKIRSNTKKEQNNEKRYHDLRDINYDFGDINIETNAENTGEI